MRFGELIQIQISIHALREEGDLEGDSYLTLSVIFLSTPSARRATPSNSGRIPDSLISIHALREEGDCTARAQA